MNRKQSHNLKGSSNEIAGFHMPPAIAAELREKLLRETDELFAKYGARAFENPRGAALVHEAGHAIVGQHDGITPARVAIWKHPAASKYPVDPRHRWVGNNWWSRRLDPIDLSTDRVETAKRVTLMIAGAAGEKLLAPEEWREASSLDEIVLAQFACQVASDNDDILGAALWAICTDRAVTIIEHNEAVARELIAALDKTETIRGTPLAKILSRVRKIPDDPLDTL